MSLAGSLEGLQVVSFKVHQFSFAIEAAYVLKQLPIEAAPDSLSIESLIGLSGEMNSEPRTALVIKQDINDFSINLAAPIELVHLPLSSIHPLPDLILGLKTIKGLCGLSFDPKGLTFLIDLRKL